MNRRLMSSPRMAYLAPPFVLATWATIFLYLAESGRLRMLLHPLFWPVEQAGGWILLAMAAGYFLFFRPIRRELKAQAIRRVWLQGSVLIVPLILAVMLAPASFSAQALERRAGLSGGKILAQAGAVKTKTDHLELVDFAAAAYYPEHIGEVSGRKVSYLGQYFPASAPGEFRFCRVLMSCCASDATPIYLHVLGPAPKVPEMQWITIDGESFFRKDEDGNWSPCVRLTKVVPSEPPPDPYLYAMRMKPSP